MSFQFLFPSSIQSEKSWGFWPLLRYVIPFLQHFLMYGGTQVLSLNIGTVLAFHMILQKRKSTITGQWWWNGMPSYTESEIGRHLSSVCVKLFKKDWKWHDFRDKLQSIRCYFPEYPDFFPKSILMALYKNSDITFFFSQGFYSLWQ